ncbi:MAG: bis-aminopropyl spermidine synthase family protein, partial [Candidatus Diapherotrites archaeon]|nr:bis-aminopropyl spermidine synthase family protein [Candidatus Diapherotrites archaeon]
MDRTRYQIVRALKKKPMTVWQLVNEVDAHLAELVSVLRRMLRNKEIVAGKDKKIRLRKSKVKAEEKIELLCPKCKGQTILLKGKFKRYFDKFRKATKGRPLPIEEFDQGFMRAYDTMLRTAYIYLRGDLEGRKIFIIGDDDLLSLAMAITGMPTEVRVIEIDERIVDFINEKAKQLKLKNVYAEIGDARKELPSRFKKKYDTFVCDPVETIPGIKLFLSRGASALKGIGSALYFGLTHLEASNEKWYKIEEMLLRMGFAITDIIRDMSIYPYGENKWERFREKHPIF